MTDPKPKERRRVVLTDYKAKKVEEGAVDIDLGDGTVVTIPPPPVWSDAVVAAGRAQDLEAAGRALLGDADYDRFVAAGGSGTLLNAIVLDELGLDVGE